MNNNITYGVVGTTIGTVGASLSVTELQAIISICVTVFGFIISVLIPLIIKIIKWFKKAKKDGKIDEDELDELQQIINEAKEKKQDE